ncbi:flavin reductase family protein [Thiomicrospira sp. ALE5]|uniref:flavin reductase family protein n=1 Tax=Thiomicrospira sp. ALE5 TaxID=748650 RepID=UPI0008EC0A31|nr:flavin reductase [Thiomicrospira sp. ALE5]SFR62574.1 NADH-FMN oxidoreductase RutF, flavin reductase (DIM6/NTAB) family [Thiomicrospira sp. ALE5]
MVTANLTVVFNREPAMILNAQALAELPKTEQILLINSITGIKPANLVGTVNPQGQTNLAIFSSVFHMGSSPPLIGMVLRSKGDVPRHSYDNLVSSGCYTLNHVHPDWADKAHQTSAKYPKEVSEFDATGLTPVFLDGFAAPFVAESQVKYGLRFVDEMPVKHNNTVIIIGQIEHVWIEQPHYAPDGGLDLSALNSVGISGLNSYYQLERLATFKLAQP